MENREEYVIYISRLDAEYSRAEGFAKGQKIVRDFGYGEHWRRDVIKILSMWFWIMKNYGQEKASYFDQDCWPQILKLDFRGYPINLQYPIVRL